jgi:uncharacterized protein (DUF488 family)
VTIFTIGHSTRSADDFLALLQVHNVAGIVDVRTIPRSRRHPHFSSEALAEFLGAHDIPYLHLGALGGLRKPTPDSQNSGWRHAAFRGYADHMQTTDFAAGVDTLIAFADARQTAVMCAEAKWWQCHRQLIADALVARDIEVRHIMSPGSAPAHQLTPFARVTSGQVHYPALI